MFRHEAASPLVSSICARDRSLSIAPPSVRRFPPRRRSAAAGRGPCFARIACAPVRGSGRAFAPARFARLIARARGGRRAHLSPAFLRVSFAPARKRRNRLRECRFLMPHSSTISLWSSLNRELFRVYRTYRVFRPGSGDRRQARAGRMARAPRRSSHGTANGCLRDAGPVPKTVLKPGATLYPVRRDSMSRECIHAGLEMRQQPGGAAAQSGCG